MLFMDPSVDLNRMSGEHRATAESLLREKYGEASRLRVFLAASLPAERLLLQRRLDGCLEEIQDLEYFVEFGQFR